jgi:hypothetical protein
MDVVAVCFLILVPVLGRWGYGRAGRRNPGQAANRSWAHPDEHRRQDPALHGPMSGLLPPTRAQREALSAGRPEAMPISDRLI